MPNKVVFNAPPKQLKVIPKSKNPLTDFKSKKVKDQGGKFWEQLE